jgi:hypothetical protein
MLVRSLDGSTKPKIIKPDRETGSMEKEGRTVFKENNEAKHKAKRRIK